jgi:putative NADPH-quinone reductase
MHILIVDGHPDRTKRFCHALTDAYAEGARQSGHAVRVVSIARLDIPVLRSQEEWVHGALPPQLREAQDAVKWADHLVIIYPLWLGDVPAYLKAFLEQVARPDFAFAPGSAHPTAGPLKGKSARLIVTMGMPAFVYRWFFFKHSVTSFKRNILGLVGIRPVRETIIGMVETTDHGKWLESIKSLGRAAR